MIELRNNFVWFLYFFEPPSRPLLAYHLERDGMTVHDAFGVNCGKYATADVKGQLPNIWAKGCMLINCAFVI